MYLLLYKILCGCGPQSRELSSKQGPSSLSCFHPTQRKTLRVLDEGTTGKLKGHCVALEMTCITASDSSLARTSHMALPDCRESGKYHLP